MCYVIACWLEKCLKPGCIYDFVLTIYSDATVLVSQLQKVTEHVPLNN